jgi:hypothetical protein
VLCECRSEEVRARNAPLSPRARRDSRLCHLMQRAERQSASRKVPVDRLDAEGQHQSPAPGRAFESPDALAKFLDTRMGNGRAHVLGNGLGG